ncbi:MAG: PQQ-binding-like beta-propeller repeat protein [Lacipirellulaceae bacterium]
MAPPNPRGARLDAVRFAARRALRMDRAGAAVLRLCCALAFSLGLPVVGGAQQFVQLIAPQLMPGVPNPAAAPAPPFEPALAPSEVRRSFQRFHALAADAAWSEAFDTLEAIEAEHAAGLLEVESATSKQRPGGAESWKRYETVAERSAREVLSLPAAAREAYRQRVEGTATRLLAEGEQRLDPRALERVASESAASREAERALLLLGELALERGEYAAARRHWGRMHPLLVGPRGLLCGVELLGIDPNVSAETLAVRWTEAARPTDLTSISDPQGSLADALGRLALVSLREGDLARGQAELRLLEALAPGAVGRIAGRERPLAEALRGMIATSEAAAAPDRIGPLRGWQWPQAVPLTGSAEGDARRAQRIAMAEQRALFMQRPMNVQQFLANRGQGQLMGAGEPSAAPAWAVAAGEIVVLCDSGGVRTFNLATGKPAPTALPAEWRPRPTNGPAREALAANARGFGPHVGGGLRIEINGRVIVGGRVIAPIENPGDGVATNQPLLTVGEPVASRGVIYVKRFRQPRRAAVGFPAMAPRESLVGIDLRRDGKVVFEVSADSAAGGVEDAPQGQPGLRFMGRPAVDRHSLWTVVAKEDLHPRLDLVCYSLRTGAVRWRTALGSGQPAAAGYERITPRVALGDDAVFVATDLGAVAAIDAQTGRPRWITRYARTPIDSGYTPPTERNAVAPQLAGDRVLVAPTDAEDVLALDAATGRVVWRLPRGVAKGAFVGVSRGVAVIAGRSVQGIDVATGQRRYSWPESQHAGLRGAGTPIVVGPEVFWPTRDRVYVLDAATGAQTRPSIGLASVGLSGANLAVAGDSLLVVGSNGLNVLGPRPAPPQPGNPAAEPGAAKEPSPALTRSQSKAAAPLAAN